MKKIAGLVIMALAIAVLVMYIVKNVEPGHEKDHTRVEVFSFLTQGTKMDGKIYLPDSYKKKKELPAIYLIDFTEQHYKLATDEFEKVVDAIHQLDGFEAIVVSLDSIPDVDAEPDKFEEHYQVFQDMTQYVDTTYYKSKSNTFIGKGSEAGVVIMALLKDGFNNGPFDNFIATDPSPRYSAALIKLMEQGEYPQENTRKKLHFSFSTSNDKNLCSNLIHSIEAAQLPWLQFETVEYTDSDYEHTYPISYADGVRYIFEE